jgi:hypothetical protein
MEMRTMRTAGLIGGLATGALLLAGTAAQAADIEAPESTGDLVMATPEALGGLPVSPDAVTGLTGGVTDKVPGMGAVSSVPGVGSLVPEAAVAEASGGHPTAGAILEPDQLASDLEQAVPGSDVLADALAQVDTVGLGVTETDNMPEAKGDKVNADQNTRAEAPAGPLAAVPGGDLLSDLGGGLPVPLPF